MEKPILVASTDGVGTKTRVAARLNRWDTIGQDLVNHCINDILVQGARPLFFLDYIAASKIVAENIEAIVLGIVEACKTASCALIGGETAEMPGVYSAGEMDLAGTIVGVVEKESLLTGQMIEAGNIVLALPSTGLHTNGYSLARSALDKLDWTKPLSLLGDRSIGDVLLAVHASYLEPVNRLRASGVDICGLAHITGGGVIENLPRILPPNLGGIIRRGSWPEPSIFAFIQQHGDIANSEMFRVFNMGLGMLVIIPSSQVKQALDVLLDGCYRVGEIINSNEPVIIEGL
jgi:phosphoribosylformylglycinamidine cyclo-ligase